jgi:hypothetical protein
MRFGIFLASALLFAPTAQAADSGKRYLVCSGFARHEYADPPPSTFEEKNLAIMIDFDAFNVSVVGSRVFPIIDVSDELIKVGCWGRTSIKDNGPYQDRCDSNVRVDGKINRISGETHLEHSMRTESGRFTDNYYLTCAPGAKQF